MALQSEPFTNTTTFRRIVGGALAIARRWAEHRAERRAARLPRSKSAGLHPDALMYDWGHMDNTPRSRAVMDATTYHGLR